MSKNKRSIIAGILTFAALFIAEALLFGCSSPTIGNGKLDVPVEVEISYTDNLGHKYTVESSPDGISFYVSSTGNKFIEAGNGKLVLTDPKTGTTIKVSRVE